MCVAAFGVITELRGKSAVVSFKGACKEVSVSLVPKAKAGDTVVVHAGFATEIVKDPQKLYRDIVATDAVARQLLDSIEKENGKLHGREFKIMNFCGTHENTIVQYALRDLLPSNIQLVSGPGCPVCVTPEEEVAMGLIAAQKPNVILTSYGDLLRVPTRWGSLEQLKADGADIRMVYDITQSLELAASTQKEVVHFAVGFETTAPGTAFALQEARNLSNFSILSSHRITPPAMEYVLRTAQIDALLCPGHVAMVIGARPFDALCRKYQVPCIISGFEPVDILQAILGALHERDKEELSIVNQYSRVVADNGNSYAQELIDQAFQLRDARWRGVGLLSESRLVLKEEYSRLDAELKLEIEMPNSEEAGGQACMCGEVLKGAKPQMCPNFGRSCTPSDPRGPCMVTNEGACCIAYTNRCI